MEIKKISEKLDFTVEAQGDCGHGERSEKDGCFDCKKTRTVNQNYWNAVFMGHPCYRETYYTCSWSCKH